MTAHVRGSQTGEPILQPAIYPAKHPLPAKNIETFADDVVVFTQSGAELDSLLARARIDLPGLAGAEAVRRVMSHNPDSLWAIARRRSFDAAAPAVEGFVAFLTLNEEGLKRLVAGTFDASDPDPALLTPQNKTPAAVYLWAMWAKDGLVAGIPLAFEKMFTPLYKTADVYARAATHEGRKLLETMGFEPGVELDNVKAAHLHVLKRGGAARPNLPSYDRYQGDGAAKQISVTMARSIEDVMRVITVRSAVYISEQECPYLEEFDGNDFCATHLLGYIGNEPAGCIRIRYFAISPRSSALPCARNSATRACRSISCVPRSTCAGSRAIARFTATRRNDWSSSGRCSASRSSTAARTSFSPISTTSR